MTHADWIIIFIIMDIAAIFTACHIFQKDFEEDDL